MKQAIVLDWDGVVFDDDAYKTALFNALARFTAPESLEQLYQSSKDHNGFNDRRLAEAVATQAGLSNEPVLASVDTVMASTEQNFIFPDARAFVTERPSTHQLILLTAGDERIQNAKLDASGLRQCFDRVIIVSAQNTETGKEAALTTLLSEFELLLFFDDRLSTIVHLHETHRNSTSLLPIYVDRAATDGDSRVTNVLSHDWIAKHAHRRTSNR